MKTTKQVLLTTILLLASIGFGFLAFAEPTPQFSLPVSAPSARHGEVTVGALEQVIEVAETVIVAEKKTAPVKVASWQCTAPRALVQGPVDMTVTPCEMR